MVQLPPCLQAARPQARAHQTRVRRGRAPRITLSPRCSRGTRGLPLRLLRTALTAVALLGETLTAVGQLLLQLLRVTLMVRQQLLLAQAALLQLLLQLLWWQVPQQAW